MTDLRHRKGRVGEVRLHWVEADGRPGPADGDDGGDASGRPRAARAAGAPAGKGRPGGARSDAARVGREPGSAAPRPPVVLLHGFPEFWYSWRRQMLALAAVGHRVVAPDQRGYNLSEKPADVSAYRIDRLADDVGALVRHLGASSAVVAGHDWGGAVAWHLARRRPELLERLVILNAPHPAAYRRELRSPGQLLRSWYVLFFQLPRLPEAAIRAGDYAVLERILRRDPVRPDAFSDEDVAAYKAALDRPGALTAALNWYRANLRAGPWPWGGGGVRTDEAGRGAGLGPGARRDDGDGRDGDGREGGGCEGGGGAPETDDGADGTAAGGPSRPARAGDPITVPTLVLWGMRDRYLSPRLLDGLDRWVEHLRVERIPDAGHWVLADAPERVSRSMRAFLEEGAP